MSRSRYFRPKAGRPIQMFAALMVFLGCSVGEARAQSKYPEREWFFGASLLNVDTGGSLGAEDAVGIQGSVHFNLSPHFGFTVDLAHHQEIRGSKFQQTQFLLGPRLTARNKRVTASAHGLLGLVNRCREISRFITSDVCGDHNFGFGMGLGGGVDIKVSRRWAVRLPQADYLPTRLGGSWQKNIRISVGLVFMDRR